MSILNNLITKVTLKNGKTQCLLGCKTLARFSHTLDDGAAQLYYNIFMCLCVHAIQ